MRKLISRRSRAAISQLISKRILLGVTILFCVGVGVVMANMSRLSSSLIQSQALQNATLYAQAIKEARTLYSSDVVTPLNTAKAINFTHDYKPTKVTIPVPATFLIELGKKYHQEKSRSITSSLQRLPVSLATRRRGSPRRF